MFRLFFALFLLTTPSSLFAGKGDPKSTSDDDTSKIAVVDEDHCKASSANQDPETSTASTSQRPVFRRPVLSSTPPQRASSHRARPRAHKVEGFKGFVKTKSVLDAGVKLTETLEELEKFNEDTGAIDASERYEAFLAADSQTPPAQMRRHRRRLQIEGLHGLISHESTRDLVALEEESLNQNDNSGQAPALTISTSLRSRFDNRTRFTPSLNLSSNLPSLTEAEQPSSTSSTQDFLSLQSDDDSSSESDSSTDSIDDYLHKLLNDEEADKLSAEDLPNRAEQYQSSSSSHSLTSNRTARNRFIPSFTPLTPIKASPDEEEPTSIASTSTRDYASRNHRGRLAAPLAAYKATQKPPMDESSDDDSFIENSTASYSGSDDDLTNSFDSELFEGSDSKNPADDHNLYEYGQTSAFKAGNKSGEKQLETDFREFEPEKCDDSQEPKGILKRKENADTPSLHLEKLRDLKLSDLHILVITSACICCDNAEMDADLDTHGQNIFSCDLVYKFLSCLKEEERTDEVIAKIIALNPYIQYAAEYDPLRNLMRLLPEDRVPAIMGTLSPEDFAEQSKAKFQKRIQGKKYQGRPDKAQDLWLAVESKIKSYNNVHYRFNRSSLKD